MTRPSGSKVLIKKKKKFGALVASQFGSYFLQRVKGDKKVLRIN